MKKLLILVTIFVLTFSSLSYAATKYDVIVKNPDFQKIVKGTNKILDNNDVMYTYISALINENDLNRIIKKGSIDSEKKKFLSENKYDVLTFLHYAYIVHVLPKIKPLPKDHEYIFIAGVINTHRKGKSIAGASNSAEASMEKMLFDEHPLYKIWDDLRKPGKLETIYDEELVRLYKVCSKK